MSRPSEIFAEMFLAGSKNDVQKEIDRLKRGQKRARPHGRSLCRA